MQPLSPLNSSPRVFYDARRVVSDDDGKEDISV